jgi:phosphatidylserine decarboxylase
MFDLTHQYIDRDTSAVRTERLFGDRFIRWCYQPPWEDADWLCRTLASPRLSRILAFLNYDAPFANRVSGAQAFMKPLAIDWAECIEKPEALDTPRKVFERKIRYWERRPMERNPDAVVSSCDARILIGSFASDSCLFLKNKFFDLADLLDRPHWIEAFRNGNYAIFRLTPDKYHYNHLPVTGMPIDYYEVNGSYHSCNPGAVVVASPYSKNARVVTVLQTDVAGGCGIGLVAMIEIVALMIGRIEQCYSDHHYDDPRPVSKGMMLRKGQPKSLYRPGSSTTVLLFQEDRIAFAPDLIRNQLRTDVASRFSQGFGRPLIETDVKVRSTIAHRTAAYWPLERSHAQ